MALLSGWSVFLRNAIAPPWILPPIPFTICGWLSGAAVPWPTG